MRKAIFLLFFLLCATAQAYAQFSYPVRIREVDGAPNAVASQLVVSNGSLSCVGSVCTITPIAGDRRVSTQFDKTSSASFSDVTGLSVPVLASRSYRFEAVLYTTSNAAGGVKFAIAGTATATAVIYQATVTNANTLVGTTARATALATAVGDVTAVTAAYARITGTITVNAGGNLTVQFAQNASNAAASSVLVGSTFTVQEVP